MSAKKCDHRYGSRHAFRWPEFLPPDHPRAEPFTLERNVFNPLVPVCEKCGKSIGELLGMWKHSLGRTRRKGTSAGEMEEAK